MWGDGFTEWDLVRAAKPSFPGHRQPRIPAEGYFDLASVDEIARQSRQARDFGIGAFAIYHYWYEGYRPLGKPLDIILENPGIDIEYSLCWANHAWDKRWRIRKGPRSVLFEQTYETDPASREWHFKFLAKAFADKRYTIIEGKPFLQIYTPEDIPHGTALIGQLRDFVRQELLLDLHISAVLTRHHRHLSFLKDFDSVTLYQPNLALHAPLDIFGPSSKINARYVEAVLRDSPHWLRRAVYCLQDVMPAAPFVSPYGSTWDNLLRQYVNATRNAPLPAIPMAFVDFDNTRRYGARARLFEGYTSALFQSGLSRLACLVEQHGKQKIVIVSAWNEWGEGMYLQPDGENDNSRLLAIRHCISESTSTTTQSIG